MSDLISREVLMKIFDDTLDYYTALETIEKIESAPSVDAVEVRHGYWIGPGEYVTTAYGHLDIYQCSECGANITIDDHDSYCPSCGAKMDGRRESEGE